MNQFKGVGRRGESDFVASPHARFVKASLHFMPCLCVYKMLVHHSYKWNPVLESWRLAGIPRQEPHGDAVGGEQEAHTCWF